MKRRIKSRNAGKTASKTTSKAAKKTAAKISRAARTPKPSKKPSGTGARLLSLFTIGYEKAKPGAVLAELTGAKIDLVVDTRAVAASRRPGFSKRQLAAALDEAGISYLHLQKLGTPAEGREAARAGDFDTLRTIYDRHIKTAAAQTALAELVSLVKSGRRIALLCYCRDPAACHRSRIVAQVKARAPARVSDHNTPIF
jgi:uncharacterized protein (DUF488 family)